MGRLFSARHTRWDQPVIINLVDQRANAGGDPGRVIDACKNWIQAGAHPNISACFYAREIKGRVLVVYEKAPGVSLEEYFQNENIGSWRRALDLSIQILDALDYFHESGGIHGYLNFHSCMVHASGTLKLSHPGMISGFYGMDGTDETATIKSGKVYLFPGQLAGDPEYASPEVMLGTIDELGPWSDIYSIGAMLYRMLTGKLPTPVQGRTIEEIARDKTNKLPKNPVELEEDIPGPMADFILNCLDKERTVRPQSYSDARKKLEDIYCQLAEKEYTRTPPVRESFLPDSLNIQATALADLGRWQEAVGLWEEALTTRPGHIESIYNLGLTRWRHGLITDDTLVKILVDLIDSDPGHWMPRYLLGMVHMERCDHRAAGKVLKGLQETDNQRPQVEKINEYLKNNSRQTRRLARLFKGHTAPVFAVRINTEGTRILSGSMDKTLKVWDADNGKCLKTIEGHRGYVNAVDMSPDGKFAISGGGELISEDFDLKYWDLEKGTVIHDLQGHAGLIRSVALDTEKKLALSGGTDNLIKLWDLQKGSCIETLEGHQEWVNTLDFSPDGSYALSGCGTPRGSKDRTLRLWDLESKQCIRSLRGHTGSINTACFSRDGQFILSGSGNPGEQQDNTVRLWLASSGECLQQLSGHEGRINGVASGPDGRYALSCSEDKSLRIWDLETCQCIRTFVGVKGEINTLSISGDGSLAVTGCADSTLQLWEVNLGQEFFRAHHFLSIPNAQIIDISEDEYFEIGMSRARQAMAFQDYTAAAHWLREARSQKGKARDSKVMSRWVELYSRLQRKEPQGGWEIRTFETGQGSVGKVHFLGRKNLVVSGGQDGTVKIWNLTTGELAMTLDAGTGSQEGVRSISTTGDGSRLAVGNASSTGFTLWNLDTGKQDLKLDAFKNPGPLRVHFSPEGRLVFCASGQENSIKMFDAFDGRLLRKYEGHKMGINDFILSRDQQYILSASKDNTIKLWDLAGGRCVRTIKSKKLKGISSLCLSDNSRFALSASADNSIRLWDIENGKCIYIIKQLEYDVSSLHMSSDARYALTNYGDTLKMWDLSTGQILLSLEGHRGRVNSVLLSCDGRLALSGSDDGTIKHWLVDWSLEDRRPAEWDEGARTYLETFLELHTPFGAEIPGGDKINEKKLQAALVRRGKPTWTEEDFKELLHYLGCVGYGWLRPEGVRKELEKMSQESRESWLTKMINIFTREV